MPFLEHYITLQIILKNIKLLMLLVKIQFFGRQYQKACKKQFVSFCLNIDTNFDFFFIITKFSIKPSRYPTSDPPRPGWEPVVLADDCTQQITRQTMRRSATLCRKTNFHMYFLLTYYPDLSCSLRIRTGLLLAKMPHWVVINHCRLLPHYRLSSNKNLF